MPIGDLVRVIGGGTPTRDNPDFYGGDIPWVTPKDMKTWAVFGAKVNITQLGLDRSAARMAPANSVLIVVRSGVLKHTLPVGINQRPVAINQDMKALICSSSIAPSYLARFIKARSSQILRWVRATTADNFSIDNLKNLPIPLPSLAVQEEVTRALERADALREHRRRAIALLGDLTRSIFLDMFGDPIVNGANSPLVGLASLGNLDRGVSKHRPRNAPTLLGGPYPLIQTGDVARSEGYITTYSSTYSAVGFAQSKLWPKGTLCITIAANIAKTGVLQFDACFPDSVVGFTASPDTVEYVRICLSFFQTTLERTAPESAQKNINLATLRELQVPRPPDRMIAQFAARIRAIEDLKAQHQTQLAELDGLFAAVQHRAFRGELWDDPAE